MTAEIKKLNKLLDKLEKNIEFIKSGAVVDNSNKQPLKVITIVKHESMGAYLMLTEQLDNYLCFDVDSLDIALARKEVIK